MCEVHPDVFGSTSGRRPWTWPLREQNQRLGRTRTQRRVLDSRAVGNAGREVEARHRHTPLSRWCGCGSGAGGWSRSLGHSASDSRSVALNPRRDFQTRSATPPPPQRPAFEIPPYPSPNTAHDSHHGTSAAESLPCCAHNGSASCPALQRTGEDQLHARSPARRSRAPIAQLRPPRVLVLEALCQPSSAAFYLQPHPSMRPHSATLAGHRANAVRSPG